MSRSFYPTSPSSSDFPCCRVGLAARGRATAVAGLAAMIGLALVTGASDSRAEDASEARSFGIGDGDRTIVAPLRGWRLELTTTLNLTADAVFEPVVLAPDVIYGAADSLELGLVHSSKAQSGFETSAATSGACVTGTSAGCSDIYSGPALLAHYSLVKSSSFEVAADGGPILISISDPSALSVKLGLIARKRFGQIAIWSNPNIAVGVTSREIEADGVSVPFNKERINLPLSLTWQPSANLSLALESGIRGSLDGFGDSYQIPATVGARFRLSGTLGVGAAFGFGNIGGNDRIVDNRALTFTVGSRI